MIKLTRNMGPLWINERHIVAVWPIEHDDTVVGAKVLTVDGEDPWIVDTLPDEILAMIAHVETHR